MAFQSDTKGKLKISRRRTDQLVVSNQVVTYSCCGLSVIIRGFISHLIGRETINIPEIFSGVHGFTGKTVRHLSKRFNKLSLFKKDKPSSTEKTSK